MSSPHGLHLAERPARGRAEGLLVVHHGRGVDERDVLPLAGMLDPDERLHVVAPRAPLPAEGTDGYRWYEVAAPGRPDPETFAHAFERLAVLHDSLWSSTGIGPSQTVLAGHSMGAVISLALALSPARPAPAAVMAFSGFLPELIELDTGPGRARTAVFQSHGRRDEVIAVEHARAAAQRLREAGLQPDYRESDGAHRVDPRQLAEAAAWLAHVLQAREDSAPAPASP